MLAPGKDKRSVRPPSAAGLYYPKDGDGLRRALTSLLGKTTDVETRVPKALVVPHAAYGYSGEVAAAAYHLLDTPAAANIRHVVLLGPTHRLPMRGLAMPSCDWFSTPCGEVPIATETRQHMRELGLAGVADAPHAMEHSLEVQVPFLQSLLTDFDLLPIAVGSVPGGLVRRALEAVWGGPETLVVVSSDLSHHHTHVEAQEMDTQTARAILDRRSDVSEQQACGATGINGLMEVAQLRRLEVRLLDRRTSGDTAGDNSRVVGYGAFALYESS